MSLDDVQVPHVFLVASHTGCATGQSASSTQPPH